MRGLIIPSFLFKDMIDIKNINRRIQRIKDYDMRPVTITSAADIVEKLVERKGTSKEGEFKPYSQVKKENPTYTREQWEKDIKDFLDTDYGKQTYFNKALNQAYEEGMQRVNGWSNEHSFTKELIKNMSKKEVVEFLRGFKEQIDIEKEEAEKKNDKTYSSSQTLYNYSTQWIENLMDTEEGIDRYFKILNNMSGSYDDYEDDDLPY